MTTEQIEKFKAYQLAEWSGAPAHKLADMRTSIIWEMQEHADLTDTQATFRFWRLLAEVRDNEM